MKNYARLEKQFQRLSRLSHAETFLSWDQQVMMPPGGAEGRAEALAELSGLRHELLTAAMLGDCFEAARSESLSPDQQANLHEMRRHWKQAICLPADLVEARSLAASRCENDWRRQRSENDWDGFLPRFEHLVALVREEAHARLAASEEAKTPYDALLELYAPGESNAFISEVFADLKQQLPPLIQTISDDQKTHPQVSLEGSYDLGAQQQLSRQVMRILGFDFNAGRLDVSTHPFSTGVRGDHRITTRYRGSDFLDALMATVHETGHASYEAGLPAEWSHQPLGQARSMSIHESQSLLFEKQLFLSPSFIQYLTPQLHEAFPALQTHDWRSLWSAMTRVQPDYIRVEADEVTYPMHIVLRYEIESDLINGKIEARDIPDLWNEKMLGYLGLSTEGDFRNGCLQDIHWPSGAFGYFPTYTLGALNAAQLFHAIRRDLPELDECLLSGDTVPLRRWLQTHIWSHGCRLSTPDLMQQATGETTSATYFLQHIRRRYLNQ